MIIVLICSSDVPACAILCIKGSKKAAVLPVPVCAQPIRSLLAIMIGMAASWIGVGFVKPMASNPASTSSCKLSSEKVKA